VSPAGIRELDLDDQRLVREWVTGGIDPEDSKESESRSRRFDQGLLVDDEIISHFIDQAYLDPEDDRVLEELLNRPIAAGLTVGDLVDREQLRAKLRERHSQLVAEAPATIPVSPQKRRRTARSRVNERTGSVVARILQDLQLGRAGREVAKAIPGLGTAANVQAVTRLLNTAVNGAAGIGSGERGTLSADENELTLRQLDTVGDQVRDRIKQAIDGRA
jgi:DNA repair protein RadD